MASATAHHQPHTRLAATALALGMTLLGGCATTQLGSQYADPQFPAQTLRGATVLVVCEAPETALRLICEREMSGQLAQLGARPLTDASLASSPAGREPDGRRYLPAARAAGARAVFSTALSQEPGFAAPPPWLSIGLGSWGWSGVSGGVGVTLPVGGYQSGIGLAATAVLNDVASGRLMWTAKASTPSAEASQQLAELARVLAEAARQTGLF
jgi:hypothetical protein